MKWEYLAYRADVSQDHTTNFQAALDGFGQRGWDLVAITDAGRGEVVCVFKRPLPPTPRCTCGHLRTSHVDADSLGVACLTCAAEGRECVRFNRATPTTEGGAK